MIPGGPSSPWYPETIIQMGTVRKKGVKTECEREMDGGKGDMYTFSAIYSDITPHYSIIPVHVN